MLLTRDEGVLIQSVPPLVSDYNSFGLFLLACYRVALGDGMFDEQVHVLRLLRVEYVPEVDAVGNSSLGELVWKETPDVLVALHHFPDRADGQLVVEWDVHAHHFVETEEFLVVDEDGLQKVYSGYHRRSCTLTFVYHVVGRQVELEALAEVPDEVRLRPEATEELLR